MVSSQLKFDGGVGGISRSARKSSHRPALRSSLLVALGPLATDSFRFKSLYAL